MIENFVKQVIFLKQTTIIIICTLRNNEFWLYSNTKERSEQSPFTGKNKTKFQYNNNANKSQVKNVILGRTLVDLWFYLPIRAHNDFPSSAGNSFQPFFSLDSWICCSFRPSSGWTLKNLSTSSPDFVQAASHILAIYACLKNSIIKRLFFRTKTHNF